MTFADTFSIVGVLRRIPGDVVVPDSPEIMNLRLPLHVSDRIELTDFIGFTREGAVTTNRPVHDITGNTLLPANEGDVIGSIQRTIVNLPVADVSVVEALLDV